MYRWSNASSRSIWRALISVHNNFRGYNVHKEKRRSQKISIKKDQNPRDFIICTHIDDYKILERSPFNVVLQNLPPEQDDGSLSWEALRRNVRYLNIETRLGYLTQQKKMLDFVEKNLKWNDIKYRQKNFKMDASYTFIIATIGW